MHPFHHHREHQGSHRRVGEILKGEPSGAKAHSKSDAFSKVTSKTAAQAHDTKVAGNSAPKRYARGGKVKHGHQTNIAIVVPHRPAAPPMPSSAAGLPAGPAGAPPMAGPGLPPPGGMPGAPPPGMPPGMPMRARGGKVIDGESTKADIGKWGKRAKSNNFARGGVAKMTAGSASGEGRLELAAIARKERKGRK